MKKQPSRYLITSALPYANGLKHIGHLAGAYLDVFATEPLPEDSPLWDMPNVLVTAHDASTSDAYDPRINALFLDNLARWRRNEPLLNEVTQL